MLLVAMFQDVSSTGNAKADSLPLQDLSVQKNVTVFRIHDDRPFIDRSDLKAALVAFLISWILLCIFFACNKEA